MCTPVLRPESSGAGRPVQRSGPGSGSRSLTEIVGRRPVRHPATLPERSVPETTAEPPRSRGREPTSAGSRLPSRCDRAAAPASGADDGPQAADRWSSHRAADRGPAGAERRRHRRRRRGRPARVPERARRRPGHPPARPSGRASGSRPWSAGSSARSSVRWCAGGIVAVATTATRRPRGTGATAGGRCGRPTASRRTGTSRAILQTAVPAVVAIVDDGGPDSGEARPGPAS